MNQSQNQVITESLEAFKKLEGSLAFQLSDSIFKYLCSQCSFCFVNRFSKSIGQSVQFGLIRILQA